MQKTSLTVAMAALLLALAPVVMAQAQMTSATSAAHPASAASATKASKANSSVVVLDQLLRADNDAAIAALRKSSLIASVSSLGLNPGPVVARDPIAPPPTRIHVAAIYGEGTAIKANVLVNGIPTVASPNALLGERLVVSIADRCVVLRPVYEKAKAARCPSACWTGEAARTLPPTHSGLPLPGSPLPRF